jgi:hypothetical protein
MWFNKKDLTIKPIITTSNLHGYILPHAGTAYTGDIISHTLRFRPTKKVNKIIILYYPSSNKQDITESDISYYHEYYIPWKSLTYILGTNNTNTITYEGYNINDIVTKKIDINQIKHSFNLDDTLIVVSSDFSHFLPFTKGISLENKAAHSLMFRELTNSSYINIVDDVKTYRILYKIIPAKLQLQWIGRTRSDGEKSVGYLSFLLREIHTPDTTNPTTLPDGIFITAFDKNMNARECLGNWYNNNNINSGKKWSSSNENELRDKVIRLAQTTSRLTGGSNIKVPLSNYTVTYLYKDTVHNFIRGYHGILHNAFYLPEVFLENTFNNGRWIKNKDTMWQSGNTFNLNETFKQLNSKAGITINTKRTKKYNNQNNNQNNNYILYNSSVMHYKIF